MAEFFEVPLFTVDDYKNNRFDSPASYLPLCIYNKSVYNQYRDMGILVNGDLSQRVYSWVNDRQVINETAIPRLTAIYNNDATYDRDEKSIVGGPGSLPFFYGQRVRIYENLRNDLINKGYFETNGLHGYVLMTLGGARINYFNCKAYSSVDHSTIDKLITMDYYGIKWAEYTNVASDIRDYGDYGYLARPYAIKYGSEYYNYHTKLGYSTILEMLNAEGSNVQSYIDEAMGYCAEVLGGFSNSLAPQGGALWYVVNGSLPATFTGNNLSMCRTLFISVNIDEMKNIVNGIVPSSSFDRSLNTISGSSGYIRYRSNPIAYSMKPGLTGFDYNANLDIRNFIRTGYTTEPKIGKYWEGYPNGGNDDSVHQKDGSSGQGDYDNTNDPIEFPAVPLKTASLSGMVSLWNPEINEISQLNNYLWSPEVIDIMKKFWNDPMDGIISLSLVPIDVGATEYREVRIGGNYTGIRMKRIFNQIQKVNMGKLKFAEYFGSFADYSPYTTVYLYLPYIGMTQLNVDDIMDCDLELEYMIDLFDGTTVANLRSVRVWDELAGIVGSWAGNCQTQIPVSSVSYREMLAGAARAGIGMLTGSMVAGAALGAQPQPQWKNNPFYVPETGEFMSYRTLEGDNTNVLNERAMGGSLQMQGVQGMNMGLNAKGQVSRGGNANCTAGALSVQTPYLIINRPVSAMPDGINDFIGYPSYSRGRLGDQQGFTQVLYVKLENLTATQKERAELDQILKGGVIF